MTRNPSEVEQAVSRTLRDNLQKLQGEAEELHHALNDLVSACASTRPLNSLPPMLRAQTAAASLAASLEVLSKFVTAALQPVPQQSVESYSAEREAHPSAEMREVELAGPEPSGASPESSPELLERAPVAPAQAAAPSEIFDDAPKGAAAAELMPIEAPAPAFADAQPALDAAPASQFEQAPIAAPPVPAAAPALASAIADAPPVAAPERASSEVPALASAIASAVSEAIAAAVPELKPEIKRESAPESVPPASPEISDPAPATVPDMAPAAAVSEAIPVEAAVPAQSLVVEFPPLAPVTDALMPVAASNHSEAPPAAEAVANAFSLAALPPEAQELHRRASRVAKVSMQDIKMLHPGEVGLGKEHMDLCFRLRDDIERARKEYDRRFQSILDHPVDYFYDWMVEILGDGNPQLLGKYPYPSPVSRRSL